MAFLGEGPADVQLLLASLCPAFVEEVSMIVVDVLRFLARGGVLGGASATVAFFLSRAMGAGWTHALEIKVPILGCKEGLSRTLELVVRNEAVSTKSKFESDDDVIRSSLRIIEIRLI